MDNGSLSKRLMKGIQVVKSKSREWRVERDLTVYMESEGMQEVINNHMIYVHFARFRRTHGTGCGKCRLIIGGIDRRGAEVGVVFNKHKRGECDVVIERLWSVYGSERGAYL